MATQKKEVKFSIPKTTSVEIDREAEEVIRKVRGGERPKEVKEESRMAKIKNWRHWPSVSRGVIRVGSAGLGAYAGHRVGKAINQNGLASSLSPEATAVVSIVSGTSIGLMLGESVNFLIFDFRDNTPPEGLSAEEAEKIIRSHELLEQQLVELATPTPQFTSDLDGIQAFVVKWNEVHYLTEDGSGNKIEYITPVKDLLAALNGDIKIEEVKSKQVK